MAESAALTPDLEEGLITSARLLIAGKMQMAAAEVRRSGGRYATLYKTIASSCTICAENPTPTWALRASRITQDELERRIYLENARLELFGVPVGFLPRLSIPAPGVERASGFLEPRFLQSDIYGFGIKTPYYRVLGPSADATLTPFVTTGGAALIEGEYRQRFANGGFDFWGVFARRRRPGRGRRLRPRRLPHHGRVRPAARLRLRLRPRRRLRRQLPHPVRLFRHRPADELRPRPPHPRRTSSSASAPSPSRA